MKVALCHTYITLPQVASLTARLWTRLKLGQEDKTNMFVTFLSRKKKRIGKTHFPTLALTLILASILIPDH